MATPIPVKKVVTHYAPHPDEVAALALALERGKEAFPGLVEAFQSRNVEFVGAGTLPPNGKTAAEMEAEGVLAFGVWGGRFDEHATMHGDAKSGETTTMLVAKHLGIQDDRGLKGMYDWIRKNDNEGKGSIMDIGSLMRGMLEANPLQQFEMLRIAVFLLQSHIQYQGKGQEAFQTFAKATQVVSAKVGGPRPLTIGIIRTDNARMATAVRHSQPYLDLAIYIQPRSTRFQIIPNRYPFPQGYLENLAVMVRCAELSKRGVAINALTEEQLVQLSREGNVDLVPEWALLPMVDLVANGTHTNPFMPATKLTPEELLQLAEAAFEGLGEDEAVDDEEGEGAASNEAKDDEEGEVTESAES